MYHGLEVGPALGRLRRKKDLTQEEVEKALGLSSGAASRIESPSSNPQTQKLLRYLDAISASLSELDRELGRGDDPIEDFLRDFEKRLKKEPDYLGLLVEKLNRFDSDSSEIDRLKRRLSALESRLDGDVTSDSLANGTED